MKISKIQALVASGILIGSAAAFASNTAADANKAESLAHAERCISIHSAKVIKGTTNRCDKVQKAFLDETTLAKFEVAYASHKKVKAEAKAQAAQQKAEDEKAYKELVSVKPNSLNTNLSFSQKRELLLSYRNSNEICKTESGNCMAWTNIALHCERQMNGDQTAYNMPCVSAESFREKVTSVENSTHPDAYKF